MSRTLSILLGEPEKEITAVVSKLESLCGYPSEDVRLLAEAKQKVRVKTAELGLDPDDTTDEELYHALRTRFHQDSQALDRALGIDEYANLDERVDKAIQLVKRCASVDEMWVVKNSVARAALTKNPPRQTAKKLNYRSVNSLLKREDIAEIFLAANITESATWQRNITKHLAKLSASDYELRPVKIVALSSKKWRETEGPASHTAESERIGAVGLWPADELQGASVLSLALSLLSGLQALNHGSYKESLHELNPALLWWADCSYVISDGNQPVSFNLKDMAFNILKKHDLKAAISHHGGQSLWQELVARYQKISDSVSEVMEPKNIPDAQPGPSPKLPISQDLAAELAAVE